MSEAPTVYCPKEQKEVPIWYCLGSFTHGRVKCSYLVSAVVYGGESAEVECKGVPEQRSETMTIDKAIEVLAKDPSELTHFEMPDYLKARQLGIEAMKKVQFARSVRKPFGCIHILLPGETED